MLSFVSKLALLILVFFHQAGCFAQSEPYANTTNKSKTINAAVIENFPPLFQIDSKNQPTGFAIEILEAIAQKSASQINYQIYPNWEEALTAIRTGKADLIPGIGIDPTRQMEFLFSSEIETTPISLFIRKSTTDISFNSLFDLKNRRVGAIKGSAAAFRLQSEKELNLILFSTLDQALFSLLAGSIDALLAPETSIWMKAREIDVDNRLKIAGPPLVELKRGFLFSKSRDDLYAQLDPLITEYVRSNEYQQIYLKWFGQPTPFWTTGRVFWTMLALSILGIFGMLIGRITTQKKSENELRLYANMFKFSGEAMLVTNKNNQILKVNQAFTELTGYSPNDVIGKDPRILASEKTEHSIYREMWESLNNRDFWQGELWDRRKDGSSYPKWVSISAIRNKPGEHIVNYVASFTDITELKAQEARLNHMAHHDALTGLPNRSSMTERLSQALHQAHRNRLRVAVMLLDLDNFKIINDTLGHHVGDEILKSVSLRLLESVRESDVVSRLGGDEFVIILPEIDGPSDAAKVADKLLKLIGQPYHIEGNVLTTSPSIGICIYPDDALEAKDLLRDADLAMYHAKSCGRGNYQFFAQQMQAAVLHRSSIEHDLREGLAKQAFELHYQPQVDLRNGKITGVEALVRWHHPERGMIAPNEFIPIAEETNLIMPLGDWILNEACRQLAEWQSRGLDQIRMSVNLSARQFSDPNLPKRIAEILAKTGLPASYLDLEVTESMTMDSPDKTIKLMEQLASSGLTLSVDDFGTGYSSLAYLKLFPIQTLKVDRSFVKDIDTVRNDAEICDVTVLLAHKLGLEVVAEGVENDAQIKHLLSIGCERIQGFRISKGLPADEAEKFIRNFKSVESAGSVDLWPEVNG